VTQTTCVSVTDCKTQSIPPIFTVTADWTILKLNFEMFKLYFMMLVKQDCRKKQCNYTKKNKQKLSKFSTSTVIISCSLNKFLNVRITQQPPSGPIQLTTSPNQVPVNIVIVVPLGVPSHVLFRN
jgi:hypothetical protein